MDFKAIKEEYETTKTSFKKLATKYETHYKKIERVAKKEKWIKFNQNSKKIVPSEIMEENNYNHKDFEENLALEVNDIYEELERYVIDTIQDYLLIDAFILSFKLYKAYQNEIKIGNITETSPFLLQQLQIQQNNLLNLTPKIDKMKQRYLKLKEQEHKRQKEDERLSKIDVFSHDRVFDELYLKDKKRLDLQKLAKERILERHKLGELKYQWEVNFLKKIGVGGAKISTKYL